MNETINQRMSRFLKFKGLTHGEFSESIGMKRSTFSNKIQGSREFDIKMLAKILQTYPNLNLNWLVSGVGAMEVSNLDTAAAILEIKKQLDILSKQNKELTVVLDEWKRFKGKFSGKFE